MQVTILIHCSDAKIPRRSQVPGKLYKPEVLKATDIYAGRETAKKGGSARKLNS